MKQEVTVELAGGKRLTFETGRLAKQASGAVVVTQGDNVVLATAVAAPEPKEGLDFFPLTVDYREYTYAGGRIPGGFIKREGRPSEREVLTCRQIDRPIRPMFPKNFRNETQVIALVLSADKDNDPDVVGINAAGAALALSDIPFGGPIGAVRVGQVNGQFVVNPSYAERLVSTLNITVVATKDGVVMIESGASGVSEETVVDAIEFGHNEAKKICAVVDELIAKAGKKKRVVAPVEFDQEYLSALQAKASDRLKDALDTKTHPKTESYALVKQIKDELAKELPEGDAEAKKKLSKYYEIDAGEESSASRSPRIASGLTVAASIRSARFQLKLGYCPAYTVPLSSPAAKPRHWSPQPWELPMTCSDWKPSRANSANVSCCTTTSPRSPWAK